MPNSSAILVAEPPNRSLVGRDYAAGLQTPALLVDLDAFEANLRRMAATVAPRGRALRPHVKAHKSAEIGRRQLAAGAIGLCCATLREAETMADAGLSGLLLTTPVVTPASLARIAAVRRKVDDVRLVVDSFAQFERLAAIADPARPLGVLVDVDVGQRRTGVRTPVEAIALARAVSGVAGLRYDGVQGYYGHLQHVPDFAERRMRAEEAWLALAAVLDALSAAGLPPTIVSGGGTGTHLIDLEGPFTELQPGSYLFMDREYGAVEVAPAGAAYDSALLVAARVVSANQPDRVVIDAGAKAMSTDAGPAAVARGADARAEHVFMGDEHSALVLPDGAARPAVGDLVLLVPPHCDPTVNLHDWFHVVRGPILLDLWPIGARGY